MIAKTREDYVDAWYGNIRSMVGIANTIKDYKRIKKMQGKLIRMVNKNAKQIDFSERGDDGI